MAERDQHSAQSEPDSFEAFLRDAAQPGPARSALLANGTKLAGGRFEIARRLGEGGMGVVYEAFDVERRANVALKTLSRVDAAGIYRLKTEFRVLADVAHPNLVRLYELFADDALWFFTMDLVLGVGFDAWVRPDAAFDEGRLRAAMPQLLSAVLAIHDAGKLHRDLKPSNVLVTGEGRVVVLDFGLAIDPEPGSAGHTLVDDSVSGTPAYMAPEQAAGKPAVRASDFYALGVMLFEALTGKLPFDGRVGEMLAAKQTRDPPRALDATPGAPVDLCALCSDLLARDPAARPDRVLLRERLGAVSGDVADAAIATRAEVVVQARAELLGRDAELEALREAYRATLAGSAVVQFVSGESGMGKTALVEAFLAELGARDDSVILAGRCYERENVPYKGFDALVDELSRLLRKLPAHEAAALLPREVFALARLFPVLDRVKVVAAAPRKEVPDPNDLQRRAFAAFGELLARLRDRQPLVVFIDDVQWIDPDSVRFMRQLLLHPEPVPALLLLAHRSEGGADNALLQSLIEASGDNRALSPRQLSLAPLGEGALEVLAVRLLCGGGTAPALRGGASPDARMAHALAREAGGSPFFTAELARAALLQADGAAPPSLAQALSLHIDALPLAARRLLSVLAVAGQPLTPSVAIDAAGLQDGHAQLDTLRAEQLVRISTGEHGARRVECYHDKIRELLGARIEPALQRELSAGLSRALMAREGADPELLTRCLLAAGLEQQAGQQAALSAERALQALAFERAARLYEQALEHGRFDGARMHALRVGRADALALAGRGAVAAEAYLAARVDAQPGEAIELTRKAGEQFLICGHLDRGLELLGDALRPLGIALPRGPSAAFASMLWSRARLRMRGLRYAPRTDQDPLTLQRLRALGGVAHCLVRSDPLRFADFAARWTLLALDSGHEVELARALGWEIELAGFTRITPDKIAPVIQLADALCERTGDSRARQFFLFGRGGYALLRSFPTGAPDCELEDGRADYARYLELIKAQPYPESSYDEPWGQYFHAVALWSLGRVAEACRLVQVHLDAAWSRNDMTILPNWAGFACMALPAIDKADQAQRELERAQAAWRSDQVAIADVMFLSGFGSLACYRGRALAEWPGIAALTARARASFFPRIAFGQNIDYVVAVCAAAAASQCAPGAQRKELVHELERSVHRSRKTAGADLLQATLACAHGDAARAAQQLRRYLTNPKLPPLHAHAARRRLGVIIGGSEGAVLVAEADAFLRGGGVHDPERYTALLLPGCQLGSR